MSQTIREYVDRKGKRMLVTAYVGPNGNLSVQFTLLDCNNWREAWVGLSEEQIKDLIDILQKRLSGELTATGDEAQPYLRVYSNGRKEVNPYE